MWQYLHRLDRKLARAAARREALAERRRQLAEERMIRRHRAQFSMAARVKPDENRIAAAKPLQCTRPMDKWELYHWHRQCGTLDVFYMLYPTW